ncbi:hypothetical protein CCACVL1_00087 [Corchorus capsularis]|uniref:Uncharacterized protein n=1 Tax=Corchorus capsularis TaxID=210143 RepID=A0A1R3KYK0_COCAP|nr:hypothetical protein CCACVL1_00087 [Corchorus capsularis]
MGADAPTNINRRSSDSDPAFH